MATKSSKSEATTVAQSSDVAAYLDEVSKILGGAKSLADVKITSETMPFFLKKLGRGGTLGRASCRGFQFETTLPFQDLGVQLSDEASSHVRPPAIKIIPTEYVKGFQTAQGTVRRAFSENGYDYTIVAAVIGANIYRYIKWERFEDAERLIAHGQKQLLTARDKFWTDREVARDKMNRVLLEIAEKSAVNVGTNGGSFPDGDATKFKARILAHGLALFDRKLKNLDEIHFQLQFRPVVLGEELLQMQARESALDTQLAISQAERRAVEEKATIEILQAAKLSDMAIAAQKAKFAKDAELQERAHQLYLQTAREQAQSALNPYYEGLMQLRVRIREDVQSIYKSLKSKDGLSPRTIGALNGIATLYHSMKMIEDNELETLITEMKSRASTATSFQNTSPAEVLDTMERILSLTKEAADSALSSGRSSFVEID